MTNQRVVPFTIGIAVLLVAACQVPAPTRDTTPPEITISVSGARGRNIFKSIDGVLTPPNDCIRVAGTPVQLIAIAGDAGGIQRFDLSADSLAARPRIIPDSIEITPRAPESSFEVSGSILEITLTPPSPGDVRTGATAIFSVEGTLPFKAVGGSARDTAGNVSVLGFRIVGPDSTEVCRGER